MHVQIKSRFPYGRYHRCDRCDRWEKNKNFSDRSDHSDHMKLLSSDRSDNNRWDIKSSISAIVVATIAGEWFLYHNDRSNHKETGLNLSQ